MKTKRLTKIFALVAILLTSSVAMALPQGQQSELLSNKDAKKIQKEVTELSAELKLSKEKEAKITALYEAHYKLMDAKEKEYKTEKKKLKDQFNTSIKSELTREQVKKLDGLNEKKKKK